MSKITLDIHDILYYIVGMRNERRATMTNKSFSNLGEVLLRLSDKNAASTGLAADRVRIARRLKEARVRVKANKTKNHGVYCAS